MGLFTGPELYQVHSCLRAFAHAFLCVHSKQQHTKPRGLLSRFFSYLRAKLPAPERPFMTSEGWSPCLSTATEGSPCVNVAIMMAGNSKRAADCHVLGAVLRETHTDRLTSCSPESSGRLGWGRLSRVQLVSEEEAELLTFRMWRLENSL